MWFWVSRVIGQILSLGVILNLGICVILDLGVDFGFRSGSGPRCGLKP